jgi:sn-glycerol 3-phosphate transport system substrate-binding protein
MKKLLGYILVSIMMLNIVGCSSATQTATGVSGTNASLTNSGSSNTESGEPVTISFWHSMGGVNGEGIDYLVDKFNKENNQKITVVAEYQGSYDDAINKLKSAQIGNMGADLVQIYDIGSRFMIDSDWIIPMQDLIDEDGWDGGQIEPNIAAYYTIDNQLYSMPFNSSTPILYYNKDMFKAAGIDKIPTSFDEIAAIGNDLMTKGGAKQVISLGIYGWFFEQFVCKQQLHLVNNGNGRENIPTAVAFDENGAGLSIASKWLELNKAGYAPNVGRGTDGALIAFSTGESAITLGSTASLKRILLDVDDKFEVGTAYFPKINQNDQGGVSIGGGSLWALDNQNERKREATWEFIKFLVSPESQAYWNAQTGYFPITTAAHDEPVFRENIEKYPQFMTAINQLHDSNPQSAGALLSVFPEARQIVEMELEKMINGQQTAEQAVTNMAKDINKAIEDYNLVNY